MRFVRLILCGLAAACWFACVASAQERFPSRQVRLVMPFPPGSSTDIIARVMADQLSRRWGEPVVVDNVVGATGNIGAADVFRAAPDGYTLLFSPPTSFATNHFLFKNPGYDPAKWSPLSLIATVPYMLAARPDFPGSSVQDLIAYAKAHPGATTFASAGVGSTIQLAAIDFGQRAGLDLVHVPFRGAAPALTAVMASQVDFLFDVISTSIPMLKASKIKALGVGSPTRSNFLPNIATVAEQGLEDFRAMTWFAMVGPPRMAPTLIDKINSDIRAILMLPDVVDRLHGIQMEPAGANPTDTAKWFAEEANLWGGIIKKAGIKAED